MWDRPKLAVSRWRKSNLNIRNAVFENVAVLKQTRNFLKRTSVLKNNQILTQGMKLRENHIGNANKKLKNALRKWKAWITIKQVTKWFLLAKHVLYDPWNTNISHTKEERDLTGHRLCRKQEIEGMKENHRLGISGTRRQTKSNFRRTFNHIIWINIIT